MASDEIEELKKHPSAIRLYLDRMPFKKEGKEYVGICPFHSEKSGSLKLFYRDGVWLYKCFGCSASGNGLQFVAAFDKISMKEAIEKVKATLGVSSWSKDAALVESTFRTVVDTNKEYKTFSLTEYAVMEKALDSSQAAQDFLARRGISMETAKALHLGFKKSLKVGGKDSDIADAGWLAMPRIDGETVVAIHYRSVVGGRKAFSRQPGMATELFNLNTIDVFEPLYVVEGEIDCLTLEAAGFRAVSIPSASTTITPAMKDRIMSAGTVILAGDNDGGVGSEKMQKLWRELAERTYLLLWPDGMKDANEVFLNKCKGDVSIFRTEVDSLTLQARTQVIPDVYSIQEVMQSGDGVQVSEHPKRMRMPWPSVDKMANLLPGSVLALYATQTSMGKTPFAAQVSMHGAMRYDEVVLNCQGELSPIEMASILCAQVLKRNRNFLIKADMEEAARLLEGVRYYVGNPNISDPNEFLDFCEVAIRRLGVTIWVIDTFHHYFDTEDNTVAVQTAASKRIKQIAQKYGLKVIAVGQPRKAQQTKQGKRTHITDARGAAAYTDAADAVFAIHRELAKSDDDSPLRDTYEAKTLIHAQKTRSKGVGAAEAYLTFFGEFASFEEIDYAHSQPE